MKPAIVVLDKGPSDAATSPARGIDLQRRPTPMKPNPGVRRLHSVGCPAKADEHARCRCNAGYEASVWDAHAGRKIRKTFPTAAAARTWRSDAEQGVRHGTLRASEPTTVNEAADAARRGHGGRLDPHALGRPVQAERDPRLPGRAPRPRPAGDRSDAPRRCSTPPRAGARRPADRRRLLGVHHPQRASCRCG